MIIFINHAFKLKSQNVTFEKKQRRNLKLEETQTVPHNCMSEGQISVQIFSRRDKSWRFNLAP